MFPELGIRPSLPNKIAQYRIFLRDKADFPERLDVLPVRAANENSGFALSYLEGNKLFCYPEIPNVRWGQYSSIFTEELC